MEYHQYIIHTSDEAEQELFIALLSESGFSGFMQKDDSLEAITTVSSNIEDLKQLLNKLALNVTVSTIKEENWNAIWESDFEPVTVKCPDSDKIFCNIRASFHQTLPNALHEVIITPKMSFGTGHHATTYSMVSFMSQLDLADKKIIDFGTGTGVLAILAEKMGASAIVGIDIDNWSIMNAEENIVVNNCKTIQLIQAGSMIKTSGVDVVLANINFNVIVENLTILIEAAKNSGLLVFSGMLSEDEHSITEHLIKGGLKVVHVAHRNNWLLIAAEKH